VLEEVWRSACGVVWLDFVGLNNVGHGHAIRSTAVSDSYVELNVVALTEQSSRSWSSLHGVSSFSNGESCSSHVPDRSCAEDRRSARGITLQVEPQVSSQRLRPHHPRKNQTPSRPSPIYRPHLAHGRNRVNPTSTPRPPRKPRSGVPLTKLHSLLTLARYTDLTRHINKSPISCRCVGPHILRHASGLLTNTPPLVFSAHPPLRLPKIRQNPPQPTTNLRLHRPHRQLR
jgi:hypothetical protein